MGRISKQEKEAMETARQAVLEEGTTRKKRKASGSSSWIEDEWGDQGIVFFDGYHYWGVLVLPGGEGAIKNIKWTPEEWEARKERANEFSRRDMDRETVDRSLGNKRKSTRSSGKNGRAPSNKARK